MPNWCFNDISIRANSKTLNEIEEFVKGKTYTLEGGVWKEHDLDFCFHSIVPQPLAILPPDHPYHNGNEMGVEEIMERVAEVYKKNHMPDWWNWRVENWGTKWEIDNVDVSTSRGWLKYSFSTAWSPPAPVIIALSKKFPDATIFAKAVEEGGEKGSAQFKGGETVKNNNYM